MVRGSGMELGEVDFSLEKERANSTKGRLAQSSSGRYER
jgi:hypothetical protein